MARHRKARLWFALHCAQIITSELRAKDLEFMKGISERLGKDKQRAGSNPQTKKERMPKPPLTPTEIALASCISHVWLLCWRRSA